MKDYTLFAINNNFYENNNNTKYDYVFFSSVTKFIVLLGFLDCIKNHNITIYDKIKKIFPTYKYDYKFIDIINHNTQLQNDWYKIKSNKLIQSDLQKKYNHSNNIYHFVLNKLLIDEDKKDKFNYSNFNYDILAYSVYKLSGKYIDKYLESNILKDIDYRWYKIKNKPVSSYGLEVHTKSFKQLAENLLNILKKNNLNFFWDNLKIKKYFLIGHSGSFGQYLYYNEKLNCILFWFCYSNK